jgi:hypothetical protein
VSPILGIWASQNYPRITSSYESIATQTVGAGGTASVTFSSIPSGYKHLQIRSTTLLQTTNEALLMRANGDTGNNYFCHYLYGTGTGSALSTNSVPTSYYYLNSGIDSTYPGPTITDILDYSSSNKNKVIRSLGGNDKNGGNSYIWLFSGGWNNTTPITSLTIYAGNGNLNQYSHFALYGIKG